MLFKKISKLLLSVMVGLVLVPNSINVMASGVANNTQNSVVSKNKNDRNPSESKPIEITSETSEEDFVRGINESGSVVIIGQVKLTKKVVDTIEEKTKKEELVDILITNNSSLVIGDDITNLNFNDFFTIERDDEVKGHLVKIETNNPITINGLSIFNKNLNEPMFDMGSNAQVTFNSCKFNDGVLDLAQVKDGIKFDFASKIIGQDSITLSGLLNTSIELDDLNVQITVGHIANSPQTTEQIAKADKIGNGEYRIEDVTFNDLQSGYSCFVGVVLKGTDKQNNEYFISEADGLLDITFNTQLNTFNFERSRLDSNSVTFDVFFGTNGNDKNGNKQYPLTLEIREESGTVKEKLVLDGVEHKKQSYTINNLSQNTNYIAALFDNLGNEISRQTFKTLESSSGTSSNNMTNNKTEILSITSTDITRSDISDTSISILLSNQTLIDRFKKAKDISINTKGIKVSFDGTSRLKLEGLVPSKIYKNLTITYKDENSVNQTIDISQFKTKGGIDKVRDFVAEVYGNALDRDADEVGFAYWVNEIGNKTVSPKSFVINLLSENEFTNKNKTVDDKIKGLYRVIVNREPDDAGFEFWTNRYKELFAEENDDSSVLIKIANEMVNSDEFDKKVKFLFDDSNPQSTTETEKI